MLAAKQPLVVPMLLRLSNFELASIVVLVVSKQKGITLVFKTDPLKRVDINSTFDSIAVIQKFIQKEIENQLKQMFREDLPGIIHRLSQTWVKAKVETPYMTKQPSSSPGTTLRPRDLTPPVLSRSRSSQTPAHSRPQLARPYSYSATSVSLSGRTDARRTSASLPASPPDEVPPHRERSPPTFPDLEEYDPTYGLRPEGVPHKSPFRGFGSLFQPNRGLADLREEPGHDELDYDEDDYDGASTSASFDVVDWNNTPLDPGPPIEPQYDFEQYPAVGGGLITRPRMLHSPSMAQSPSLSGMNSPVPVFSASPAVGGRNGPSPLSRSASTAQLPARPQLSRGVSAQHNPYFSPGFVGGNPRWTPQRQGPHTPLNGPHYPQDFGTSSPDDTESSLETPPSFTRTVGTQPITFNASLSSTTAPRSIGRPRRSSLSSLSQDDQSPRKIVLRPSMLTLNNSIQQLTTLSHSNHTLSPYTRSLEHFTVRSGPPRPAKLPRSDTHFPVKAKRKRAFQIGKRKPEVGRTLLADDEGDELAYYSDSSVPTSPVPPSELDAMDMAHYFRTSPALRRRRS